MLLHGTCEVSCEGLGEPETPEEAHKEELERGGWQEMVAGLLGYFGTRYDLLAGDPRPCLKGQANQRASPDVGYCNMRIKSLQVPLNDQLWETLGHELLEARCEGFLMEWISFAHFELALSPC